MNEHRRLPKEQTLRAKVDSALVPTLLSVGYERIRGRRELQNAVIAAVSEWYEQIEVKGNEDGESTIR